MKILIKVKPGSSLEKIEKDGEGFVVWVREKAIDGKANEAVRKILAKEFNVGKKDILIKTFSGRKKVVEIDK